jgi:hypothetical protein
MLKVIAFQIMARTLLLTVLVVAALQAQPAESKQAKVDRIFTGFNTHTPGCAVGVAYRGDVVLKSGYGMADLERNVPITAETVFESGSVAKQFTATALLLLAQSILQPEYRITSRSRARLRTVFVDLPARTGREHPVRGGARRI